MTHRVKQNECNKHLKLLVKIYNMTYFSQILKDILFVFFFNLQWKKHVFVQSAFYGVKLPLLQAVRSQNFLF